LRGEGIGVAGGVFISYRREDSAGFAGRIYDRLIKQLDPKSVFLDVDNIQPGLDFFDVLDEKLRVCDVLIAIIGKNWNSRPPKTTNVVSKILMISSGSRSRQRSGAEFASFPSSLMVPRCLGVKTYRRACRSFVVGKRSILPTTGSIPTSKG
jgi:hypothetical protein